MSNNPTLATHLFLFVVVVIALLVGQVYYWHGKAIQYVKELREFESRETIDKQHIELLSKSIKRAAAEREEIMIHLFGNVKPRPIEEITNHIHNMRIASCRAVTQEGIQKKAESEHQSIKTADL